MLPQLPTVVEKICVHSVIAVWRVSELGADQITERGSRELSSSRNGEVKQTYGLISLLTHLGTQKGITNKANYHQPREKYHHR